MDNQRTILPHEERVYKAQKPISETALLLKRIFKPDCFFTVRQLLQVTDIDKNSISEDIKCLLDKKVSQVCRAGSRFSNNCICVELYDDGESTAKWAISHGALFCITKKTYEGIPCVTTSDTMKVFSEMCGYMKAHNSKALTTAVIGSIGKTTTKRMIASVYAQARNTYYDPENENQLDCVGNMVQHIPSKAELHVQEVSEDTPGCAHLMSMMLKPVISVITTIDESHYEAFGSQKGIMNEIMSIENGMPESGICIINYDDPIQKGYEFKRRVLTVSMSNKNADFYASNIHVDKEGLHFSVCEAKTGKMYPVTLHNIFAVHNVYSALEAFAAGVSSRIDYPTIVKGLDQFRTVGKRQNVFKVSNNSVTVYADCYNAVAKSVESALEGALKIPIDGKRIAVLGDIEEAGAISEQVHKKVIEMVTEAGFDYLYCYGEKLGKAIGSGIYNYGNTKLKNFSNKKKLAEEIRNTISEGDIVLFKGSRKSKLEDVIKTLWPKEYRQQMRKYYIPIIKWRLQTITN